MKISQQYFVGILLSLALYSCSSSVNSSTDSNNSIHKPKGLYSSSFGNESALDNTHVNGSLIRVSWSDIEPNKGSFDFSKIDQYLLSIQSRNLKWSLAVIAGGDSPDWLIDTLRVDYFEITRNNEPTKRIPKIWDPKVNERFTILAQALADKYAEDESLALVYVPQMTVNGIEGHFNGVSTFDLKNVGLTAELWVNSVKETANIFANAFVNKAIAVEVHDIMDDTSIPKQIITDLWNDSSLNKRVGAAIWWLSGKTTYQPKLLDVLIDFPGNIYGQAIGRSDQTTRFDNEDYTSLFTQAQTMGVRYIELWEYEFVNNTYPDEFAKFNIYAEETFE